MLAAIIPTFVALVGLALPASADVLVVDGSGGGDFMFLDVAIAAAADGDTLLVRPGFYLNTGIGNFISGRSLVIAADGTGEVRTGGITILAAGERVVLRGLTVEPDALEGTTALHIFAGDVFVEGCTLRGADGNYFADPVGGTAVSAGGTGSLVLKDCVVEGGRGSDSAIVVALNAKSGGRGISAGGSITIAIHGGTISGGDGGDDVDGFFGGANAGDGVNMVGGKLLVAGATISGGDGGSSVNSGNYGTDVYKGGDGVAIDKTKLHLLDATLTGGAAGQNGNGQPGVAGDALQQTGATTVVQYTGAYRSLGFGPPAPEGGQLTLAYAGAAGDLAGLFVSTTSAVMPGPQGFFHLGAPITGPWLLGPMGPTGTLALSLGVPNLGFGAEDALTLYGQALVKPASGASLLSSPTTVVLIDDSL